MEHGNRGDHRGIFRIAVLIGVLFLLAGNAAAQNALWIANSNVPTLAEYQGKLKSGAKAADHLLDDPKDLGGPSTIAFDQNENLWVTNYNSNTITEFTKSVWQGLKKHSHPAAAVTISQDSGALLHGPEDILFDSSQNMWVGSEDGEVVLVYSPAQYAASGNPTANVILNANSFSFKSPSHMAFNSAGNLWLVNEILPNGNGGTGEIFRYDSDQIAALTAGTNNVDPVFGIALPQFVHLETIAFDASGDLWQADSNADSIYEFSADQLTGTGLSQELTPAVVLGSTNGGCKESLDGPYGLAFDTEGDLFVANSNIHGNCFGSLAEFSADRIGSSGSPKPKVLITSDGSRTNLNSPNAITFGPSF